MIINYLKKLKNILFNGMKKTKSYYWVVCEYPQKFYSMNNK